MEPGGLFARANFSNGKKNRILETLAWRVQCAAA